LGLLSLEIVLGEDHKPQPLRRQLSGVYAAMLPDQLPVSGSDEISVERRLNSIRLFVIRNGKLIELERRERPAITASGEPAPYPSSNLSRPD
jgi:hypothetical protein